MERKVHPITAAITLAAVAALILVCFMLFGRKTVDLTESVSLGFSGYEGYGSVNIEIDESVLEDAELRKSADLSEYGWEMLRGETDGETLLNILNEVLKTDAENLSNGDTAKVYIDEDDLDGIGRLFKTRYKFEEVEGEVSGLLNTTEIDPFESLALEFSGSDGAGSVFLSGGEEDVAYALDKEENLSNGDTVTVSASTDTKETGLVLTQEEKTYEVLDLSEPAASLSDLSECMEEAESAAITLIKENLPSSERIESEISGYEMQAAYLTEDKTLYLVYKVTAKTETLSSGDAENVTYYTYAAFTNVSQNGESFVYSESFSCDHEVTELIAAYKGYSSFASLLASEISELAISDSEIYTDGEDNDSYSYSDAEEEMSEMTTDEIADGILEMFDEEGFDTSGAREILEMFGGE